MTKKQHLLEFLFMFSGALSAMVSIFLFSGAELSILSLLGNSLMGTMAGYGIRYIVLQKLG